MKIDSVATAVPTITTHENGSVEEDDKNKLEGEGEGDPHPQD